jgi:uncharacterized membrane protein HdeD (DUF308 family)
MAAQKMTGEIEIRRTAMAFLGHVTALLGLAVFGFPLAPSTIRSMLIGWIGVAIAIMQLFSERGPATQFVAAAGRVPVPADEQRPMQRE